jgi:hypothetical protein
MSTSPQTRKPVPTTVDAYGDVQTIPYTGTPPWGEPVAHVIPEQAAFGNPWDSVTAIYAGGATMIDTALEDDLLHAWIHDAGPNYGTDYPNGSINSDNPGVPNLGPPNEQLYQSSHTSAVQHNSSAEQGFGMDPAILVARFPRTAGDNPYHGLWTHKRNGQYEYVPDPAKLHTVTQGTWQAQWQKVIRVSSMHARLVDVPQSVPFSQTVRLGGGSPGSPLPVDTEGIY